MIDLLDSAIAENTSMDAILQSTKLNPMTSSQRALITNRCYVLRTSYVIALKKLNKGVSCKYVILEAMEMLDLIGVKHFKHYKSIQKLNLYLCDDNLTFRHPNKMVRDGKELSQFFFVCVMSFPTSTPITVCNGHDPEVTAWATVAWAELVLFHCKPWAGYCRQDDP